MPCASLTATRVASFNEDIRRYFRVPEAVWLLYSEFIPSVSRYARVDKRVAHENVLGSGVITPLIDYTRCFSF